MALANETAAIKELASYCAAQENDAYIIKCAREAVEKLAGMESKAVVPIPPAALSRAILEYGKELFDRRQSRSGIAGLDSPDFQPMRIARDPMKAAMPFIQDYMGPAIA